jgi:hypothetical protein
MRSICEKDIYGCINSLFNGVLFQQRRFANHQEFVPLIVKQFFLLFDKYRIGMFSVYDVGFSKTVYNFSVLFIIDNVSCSTRS